MATQTLSPGDPTALTLLEIVSTTATELGEDFETDRDCILRGVKYEFAAGVVYTIKLRPSSTGPDVVLKTGTAVAGGDTGIVASGHALSQGGRINVVTTGAISGNKKVSVEVSPAQVGA